MNSSIQTGQDVDVDEDEQIKDSQDEAGTPGSSDLEYKFHVESISNREEKTDEKDDTEKSSVEDKQTEAPSQEDTSTKGNDTTSSATEDSDATTDTDRSIEEPQKPRKKFRSDDPIYWYGILVPPSLRNAQKSFTEGVQTQVPELAGTIVEMRALEQRITQLRAKLGISTEETESQ
jgi:hypothetical protein